MDSQNSLTDKQASFYRAFEDKFRGRREMIKARLMVYLPFIEPLKEIYDSCKVIDLGCGRGEWLELVTEAGMSAHGIDLDDSMLAACRERNLSVQTGDAVSFLKSLPGESQAVISGFHIIEHIAFADLQILIQEAFRVLKPAGLLILETPNPESLVVASTSFHLDPSHLKPIPPELLAFLTEYYGFYRNKILRLQEPLNPMEIRLPNFYSVLYGVSPDYSVVAQKLAAQETLSAFGSQFNKEYGFSLEKVAAHYDTQVAHALNDTGTKLNSINARLTIIDDINDSINARLTIIDDINARLNAIETELSRLNTIQTQLNDVYQSHSWQLTAPVRATADFARKVKRELLHSVTNTVPPSIKRSIKNFLLRLVNYVRARPPLKQGLVWLFGLVPAVDRMVLRLSRSLITDRDSSQMKVMNTGISNQESPLLETEKHFLDLFQRESGRQQADKRTGDNQ